MTLTKGDHLVIKRGDKVLTDADDEAYHEFEVVDYPVTTSPYNDDDKRPVQHVGGLRIVK